MCNPKSPPNAGQFASLVEIRLATELLGGAKGDRTPDLGIANAALSQLSYRPYLKGFRVLSANTQVVKTMRLYPRPATLK